MSKAKWGQAEIHDAWSVLVARGFRSAPEYGVDAGMPPSDERSPAARGPTPDSDICEC